MTRLSWLVLFFLACGLPVSAQTSTSSDSVPNDTPTVEARLAQGDKLVAFLRQRADLIYTSYYSEALLQLTELGDARALPFIENYFRSTHLGLDDLYSNDRIILGARGKIEQLYWPLRWRGLTPRQKVASFQSWSALLNQAEREPPPATPIIGGITEAISTQGDAVLPLLMRCALRFNPDTIGYAQIIEAISLINTPASLQTLRYLSHSYRGWDGGNQKNGHIARLALIHKGDKTAVPEELAYLVGTLKKGEPSRRDTSTDALLYEIKDLAAAGADKAVLETAIQPYIAQGNSTALFAQKLLNKQPDR